MVTTIGVSGHFSFCVQKTREAVHSLHMKEILSWQNGTEQIELGWCLVLITFTCTFVHSAIILYLIPGSLAELILAPLFGQVIAENFFTFHPFCSIIFFFLCVFLCNLIYGHNWFNIVKTGKSRILFVNCTSGGQIFFSSCQVCWSVLSLSQTWWSSWCSCISPQAQRIYACWITKGKVRCLLDILR